MVPENIYSILQAVNPETCKIPSDSLRAKFNHTDKTQRPQRNSRGSRDTRKREATFLSHCIIFTDKVPECFFMNIARIQMKTQI